MKEQLRIALITLSHYHDHIALLLSIVVSAAFVCVPRFRLISASVAARNVGLLVCAAACLSYIFAIAVYLIYPSYFDSVQALVASVSLAFVHGRAMYPYWETEGAYSMVYGPLLYMLHGYFLDLNPTIFMSKLPGVAALIAALILIWLAAKRISRDEWFAFVSVAVTITLLIPYGVFPTYHVYFY